MRTYWQEYFDSYDKQVQYAKTLLGISYQPHKMCVDCVVYHTKVKGLSFNIKCTPLPHNWLDQTPENERDIIILQQNSPYYFAKYILKMDMREFQKHFLSCTAKRKVLRIARRQGKSHAMQMYMLWYQITKPGSRIRIAAPRETHVAELFDKMEEMIKKSGVLLGSLIIHGKHKLYSKNPNYEFKFTNGSTIRGITTGDTDGLTMRSQSADLIVLDETDYISDEQFQSIYPLIATSDKTELIQQSTPSGRQTYFKSWCFDPGYKELHLRYIDLETYDPEKDEEFKRNMGKDEYMREMMAEFITQEAGVFPNNLIDQQLDEYEFDQIPPPGGIYTFGIDWNESVQGVHIVIVRYESWHDKFRVSNIVVVEPSEFTQVMQIEKVIELYSYYKPKKIVMDEGYGITQIQQLKMWGMQNDEAFLDQLETVQFGKQIEITDPLTGMIAKTYAKEYIVQITKRMLENGKLILPKSQDTKTKLVGQMRNYVVEKVMENGQLKFSKGNVHTLEAMMLQLYGMYLIKDQLQNGSVMNQPKPLITSMAVPRQVNVQTRQPRRNIFRYYKRRWMF